MEPASYSTAKLAQEGYSTDQLSSDRSDSERSRTDSPDLPSPSPFLNEETRARLRLTALQGKLVQYTYVPSRHTQPDPTHLARYLGHSGPTNISHIPFAFLKGLKMIEEELNFIFRWAGTIAPSQLSDQEHLVQYSTWLKSLYNWEGCVGNLAIYLIDIVMDAWGFQNVPNAYPETIDAAQSFWWDISVATVIAETLALHHQGDAPDRTRVVAGILRLICAAWWRLCHALGKDISQQAWGGAPDGFATDPLKDTLLDGILFKAPYDYDLLWEHAEEVLEFVHNNDMGRPGGAASPPTVNGVLRGETAAPIVNGYCITKPRMKNQ